MVRVNLTAASFVDVAANVERIRTFVYSTDGDSESTQGTLRDNRRADEIKNLVLKGSPQCVDGPVPEGWTPVATVSLLVVRARGNRASHRVDIVRQSFDGRHYDVWRRMQGTADALRGIVRRAGEARAAEKAAKAAERAAKPAGGAGS